MEKNADAFRTISEVADDLDLPQHVLRFWETRFPQIRPLKRAGGRRYYRPTDVALLRMIRQLLYDQGYTIKGVQRLLREQGAKGVREGALATAHDFLDDHAIDAPSDAVADIDVLEIPAQTASAEVYLPKSILAALDTAPSRPRAAPDLGALREALATIEDCERILRAARG